ncbi:MAG: PIN domain-containing protein [Betaproteobacteria bacterium]|jgi:predicted nucleic acid-binding protein
MRPFVDTNVVVYALTDQDPHKQAIAQRLLAERGAARPSLSTQVLAETYAVLTRKQRWTADDALAAVTLLKSLRVVALTPENQIEALRLAVEHRLSGWDAMVVQAALQAGCDTLFSEDLQPGRRFGGLEVVNPFDAAVGEPAVARAGLRAPRPAAPRAAAPRRPATSAPSGPPAHPAPADRARRPRR